MPAAKANKTTKVDVDNYLASLPEDARKSLEHVREVIRSVVSEGEECISYQVPAFKYHGNLVGYAALPKHLSFFVMSPAVLTSFSDELKDYSTSKGTIRFSTEKPLPDSLIKKIVKARIDENMSRIKK